jgi:hypothetical protein
VEERITYVMPGHIIGLGYIEEFLITKELRHFSICDSSDKEKGT